MKNWHVIEKYKADIDWILCVCGWEGSGKDPWYHHRKENANDPAPKGFNKKNYVYGAAGVSMGIKVRK